MHQFTLDDLSRLLRSAGGSGVDLATDKLDEAYPDLGYDSLAILEMAVKLQQEFGVTVADEDVLELRTPRRTLDYVNRRMSRI